MKKKILISISIFFFALIIYNIKVYAVPIEWNKLLQHVDSQAIVKSAYSASQKKQTIENMKKKMSGDYDFEFVKQTTASSVNNLSIDKAQKSVCDALGGKSSWSVYKSSNWYDHTGKELESKQVFPNVFLQAAWRYNIILYRESNILYCAFVSMHHNIEIDDDGWDNNIYIYLFKKTLSNFGTSGGSFHNVVQGDSTSNGLKDSILDLAKKAGAGTANVTISESWGSKTTEQVYEHTTVELYKNSTKKAEYTVGDGKNQVFTRIEFKCYDETDRLIWYNKFSTSLYDESGNKKSDDELENDLSKAKKEKEEWADKSYDYALSTVSGESRTETVFKNDVLENIDQYKPNDIDSTSAGKIETATSKILTVISNIGIAVSVIMLAILGLKYMMGSVEEKAEYKQGLIPYVIGAFILFGVTTFVKILMAFGDKIANI